MLDPCKEPEIWITRFRVFYLAAELEVLFQPVMLVSVQNHLTCFETRTKSNTMRILLVEDEPDLGAAIEKTLIRDKYVVDWVQNGDEAWGYLDNQWTSYTIAILDWMLPGLSGIELCRRLRAHNNSLPVLILTARDRVEDRVAGLDAGADDYLVKPFELRELLARVRALLRRPTNIEPVATPRLQVEDLELDLQNQIAYRNGRAIDLSEKESQLLEYFMRQPNQLLTHDQIYQYLWGEGEKPTSNALAAQVRLLRRKIEAKGEAPLISTVYGKGYRFGNS